jgi:hypothetical protein
LGLLIDWYKSAVSLARHERKAYQAIDKAIGSKIMPSPQTTPAQ